jgi:hypothetical protein
MANFPQLHYPAWVKGLLTPRAGATVGDSGLIGAHQIGDKAWKDQGFDKSFESIEQFGIGPNTSSNGETLARSKKGGAILGASNHDGIHPRALGDAQAANDNDGALGAWAMTYDEVA